jgi:Thiol:disulfide interchange protein DsbD, N-terminal
MSKLWLSLVSIVIAPFALAQQVEIPDWENAVRFDLVSSQEPVRPGDSFELALIAEIQPGYHLYGPKEAAPSRTKVSLDAGSLKAGEIVYPPVLRRDLSGMGEFDLYEGRIAVRIPVSLAKDPAGGELKASVDVDYQLCTDFACSAPTSDKFSIQIPRGKAGDAVKKLYPDIFTKN